MPDIGKPQELSSNNPFAGVGMAKPRQQVAADPNKPVGDQLNEMAGNDKRSGVKFVDGKAHNKMGPNEFMKLLTIQLSNQDPLNPMDEKKISGELAQFSQLEQLTNMNTKLDKLGQNAAPEMKFYGASFLGKKIVTRGTSIDFKGEGASARIPFEMPAVTKKAIVRVVDEKGQTVAEINAENLPAGPNQVSWDGKAMDGEEAGKGFYHVTVIGFDETGGKVVGKTKTEGLVTGVFFENNEAEFEIDGKKRVFLRDVESFSLSESAPGMKMDNKAIANKYQNAGEKTQ